MKFSIRVLKSLFQINFIDFQKNKFKEIRFFQKIGFLTRPKYLSEQLYVRATTRDCPYEIAHAHNLKPLYSNGGQEKHFAYPTILKKGEHTGSPLQFSRFLFLG